MNILNSVQNFLEFISENLVSILVCIGLIIGIVKKTVDFFSKSKDEQITIAKEQIKQTILKLITRAELDFDEWNHAGSIKRSQVIEEIFMKYPILSKVSNQQEIIEWIDDEINNALVTLREIVKENKKIVQDKNNVALGSV